MSADTDNSGTVEQQRRVLAPVLVVCAVTVSLIAIGKLVVPLCIEAVFPSRPAPPAPARPTSGTMSHLEDPNSAIRLETVQVLARLNPGNPHVFQRLSAVLLNDTDPAVRLEVARILTAAQPFPGVLPDLIDGLSDPDQQVREQVIIAIGDFGNDANSARPALQLIVDDEGANETVRKLAAKVRDAIGPNE